MCRSLPIVSLLLVTFGACAGRGPARDLRTVATPPELTAPGFRRALVGCYALRRADDTPVQRGRTVVYLDAAPSDPAQPGAGWWRVLTSGDTAVPPALAPFDRWRADARTDSVRIVLSYGMGGTLVVVSVPNRPAVGDVLRGRTETYDDVERSPDGGAILRGPVVARRVACGGPT